MVATVDELTVLSAEPRSVQALPCAIVSMASGTVNASGQVKSRLWQYAVRIVVAYQDPVAAEGILIGFVDDVTTAILANLTLDGLATVTPSIGVSAEGNDGYYTVNGVDYRSMVLRVDIRDKSP